MSNLRIQKVILRPQHFGYLAIFGVPLAFKCNLERDFSTHFFFPICLAMQGDSLQSCSSWSSRGLVVFEAGACWDLWCPCRVGKIGRAYCSACLRHSSLEQICVLPLAGARKTWILQKSGICSKSFIPRYTFTMLGGTVAREAQPIPACPCLDGYAWCSGAP